MREKYFGFQSRVPALALGAWNELEFIEAVDHGSPSGRVLSYKFYNLFNREYERVVQFQILNKLVKNFTWKKNVQYIKFAAFYLVIGMRSVFLIVNNVIVLADAKL